MKVGGLTSPRSLERLACAASVAAAAVGGATVVLIVDVPGIGDLSSDGAISTAENTVTPDLTRTSRRCGFPQWPAADSEPPCPR